MVAFGAGVSVLGQGLERRCLWVPETRPWSLTRRDAGRC